MIIFINMNDDKVKLIHIIFNSKDNDDAINEIKKIFDTNPNLEIDNDILVAMMEREGKHNDNILNLITKIIKDKNKDKNLS